MNAKKIMGAVLVALLAVTAFAGAGAAADVVFVYEDLSNSIGLGDGVYTDKDGKNSVMVVGGYISGDNIVEGLYNLSGTDYYVMYPDAKIDLTYQSESIIGGTIPVKESFVEKTVTSYAKYVDVEDLLFTNPDGVQTKDFDNTVAGEWKVQAYFDTGMVKPVAGKTVYTFTVIDTEPSITISADTVLKGNTFWVTVNGLPGTDVKLTADAAIEAIKGQLDVTNTDLETGITFKIPESGSMKVAVVSPTYDGKVTITATFDMTPEDVEKTAKVTIEAGEITAEAAADFYYLGTDVKLTGTNTESKTVYFYIKGNNMDLTYLSGVTAGVKADKTWEKKIEAATFENFDAGTYTVYAVSTEVTGNLANVKWSEYTYATVSLPLKQPFLTAELSATTVAQDSDLIITGTAESADNLLLYIFGNNYFNYTTITVDDDGTYEKKLTIDGNTMATGQYFVVIQHPMYNKEFNIMPLQKAETKVGEKASFDIVINTTAQPKPGYDDGAVLFNTLKRQSSNAAEALCQALDTQNIDDVYVKASFIVAQPTATMNPVSDVAKGAKLVVSGTSNMAPGTVVTVEMLSTAFAAIPKESVNSASFITLTTKVQDDGTWEVTFDTSGLNVDEYTLAATVGDIKTSTTVVKVLESAPVTPEQPTDKPEQPTDKPEQPTEPETPGFGALAALAGLGAVAVLLLRRE